ncbi:MAG: YraN family protein [Coriobacteriia bacterium]|nr:YraN family protein [Coriobacteriia bacterium]
MDPKELGQRGEDAAVAFLEEKGYEIIERNWKCSVGEIDIIALFSNAIVFVEVKTRRNLERGLPEDAVGPKKRRKYECIAAMYLRDHDYVNMAVRFDVMGVLVVNSGRALVRHHSNAFGVE